MEEEAKIDAGQDDGVKAGQDDGGDKGTVELPGWMASLPDAYKKNERFAQFKEAPEVWGKLDSLLQAEGKTVAIPDEKATDEEKAKFYASLGRPETPDGYEITKPADLPDSIPYDPAVDAEFKKFAHNINLTKEQAAKLHSWYYGLAKNGSELIAVEEIKAQQEGINTLKDKWGAKYETNTKIAVTAFKQFAGDAAETLLAEAKIGNIRLGDHPKFVETFYNLGKATLSDTAIQKGMSGGNIVSGDKIAEAAKVMFPNMTKEK